MSYEATSRHLRNRVFLVDQDSFSDLSLDVFAFQYEYNELYRRFCDLLHKNPATVQALHDIPFLPISQFKHHRVQTGSFAPEIIFESSGTTGSLNSRHEVKEVQLYHDSFLQGFNLFYGRPDHYCIIGLLPSYLERSHSSLVYMTDRLIRESGHPRSGFHLYDYENLRKILLANEQEGQPTLLIGVTYALLDFAEQCPMTMQHTIVMETGGMKGRKKEITREEVHAILCDRWGLKDIHSEYGMTELLSQAYSPGHGRFHCPPWMKVMFRQEDDPFEIIGEQAVGQKPVSGVINLIDLANLYSCAFLATDDVGKSGPNGSFEVLGRLDNSDIRGCSLMQASQ